MLVNLDMKWTSESCEMSVEGMSLKCPVCGVLVESGQTHSCKQPPLSSAPALRGKKAKRGN
jgi:hypothetical protein